MPNSAPHPCGQPGCITLVPRGRARCADHERKRDRERGTATERGYDARWRAARRRFLMENPLCDTCNLKGRVAAATVVDHIVAHKGDQGLFWDETNWRSSCKPCHDARTDEGDFGR
jgi:5-methylcytosine-specific restriction protein A